MSIFSEIDTLHPIRKTKNQKAAFRQWVMEKMAEMGYTPRVEESDRGRHHNIIVGDADHAEAIFTAHYDTPARWPLPDLVIPRNFPVYVLWQLLNIALLLAASLAVGVAAGLLLGGRALLIGMVAAFIALMMLQLYGPANAHNANDNTSGVAALLTAMQQIPEERRSHVAFILFDNCESGRRGSKAFASDHIEVAHTHLVVSLDSVGVGEHVLLMTSALARALPQYEALEQAFAADEGHEVHCYSSFTSRCGGDHRSFKCGVGVVACERETGVGFITGGLHTGGDTMCSDENITFLARCIAKYAAET